MAIYNRVKKLEMLTEEDKQCVLYRCKLEENCMRREGEDLSKDEEAQVMMFVSRFVEPNTRLTPCLVKFLLSLEAGCDKIEEYTLSTRGMSEILKQRRDNFEVVNPANFMNMDKWVSPAPNHAERYRPAFYLPCFHEGPCSEANNCPCVKDERTCEKLCNCSNACPQRFPGCNCKGKCLNEKDCYCLREY